MTARRHGDLVVVHVVDSGIGIAIADQENVFEEFVQLHNPQRDPSSGLGLGLPIVRRLSALLGISLSLRSRPGQGSNFALRIPSGVSLPRRGGKEMSPLPSVNHDVPLINPTRSGMVALVIDDDPEIRSAMRTLLAGWGYVPVVACGLNDLLPQLESLHVVPSIIISDYRLRDEENGLAIIERLHTEYNCDIAAILITGDTAADRLIQARSSGVEILHKPLAPETLRATMASLIESSLPD